MRAVPEISSAFFVLLRLQHILDVIVQVDEVRLLGESLGFGPEYLLDVVLGGLLLSTT